MLWTPWATSVPSVLVVCAVLAWWFTEPKTAHLNAIVTIGLMLFIWSIAPTELAQETPTWLFQAALSFLATSDLDIVLIFVLSHFTMIITGIAASWLVWRAWQVLRKPVPELIQVLGVEVPDPPHVFLAGIRKDAATLNWTRPQTNSTVAKFLIQVNGVTVGESSSQETAITVTGLKPSHFYNIRVIAVSHSNFQAGSRSIRLRTYNKDGRPETGNGRVPASWVPDDQPSSSTESHDDEGNIRVPTAAVETASIPESTVVPLQISATGSVTRRNTLTRKHSPSTASMDQSVKDALERVPEGSLVELSTRFENIRKDQEESQAQLEKDERDHQKTMDELTEEKKTKKQILKEKDEMTNKYKAEMNSTDRAMRSTQTKKTNVEKRLRDRENERKKIHDDMARWDKEMAQMKKRQAGFEQEKAKILKDVEERKREYRDQIEALQASLAQEEAELKEKGRELKEAEDQRKRLPGGEESEEWRDRDRQMQREWEVRCRDLSRRVFFLNRKLKAQDEYEMVLRTQLATAQQSNLGFPYAQANASGVEFDLANQTQLKRRSRTGNSMPGAAAPSPSTSYAIEERQPYAPANNFEGGFSTSRAPTIPPGFAASAFPNFSDVSAPLDDEGLQAFTAGAPLSPTATSLLPASLFDTADDDFPPSRPSRHGTFGQPVPPDNDPQSPISEGMSYSAMSSPRGSAQHLPFSHYGGDVSERTSLRGDYGTASSPAAPPTQTNNRFALPFWSHRNTRSTNEPPTLGSLKAAQSQSFPAQTDDTDNPNKRRISFSSGWGGMFNRNSAGPAVGDHGLSGLRGVTSRRLFANNNASGSIYPERDPSSPRPLSIASSEFPRPSTESGPPIWGRSQPSRIWSPEGGDPWSRTVSRRPSIHGSPSALKTNLADAEDEILDESEIRQPPLGVGVIGSRPSAAKVLKQSLNPNAPSFMGMFRTKDKDSKESKEKVKAKGKEREGHREANPRVSITSSTWESVERHSMDDSLAESRESRDALSVSESHESLSLDHSHSNTPSEPTHGLGLKDPESGLRKLLRKGSSSKFSLSSIRGSKKGPGSVTNSDKNLSMERTSIDIDEHGHESGNAAALLSRNHDSVNSSPNIGSVSGGRAKDGRASWTGRFSMKKKQGKDKDDESAPPTPALGAMSEDQ
ncbi:RTA1 like protein-domain-containing protein [Apiospora arundinis]